MKLLKLALLFSYLLFSPILSNAQKILLIAVDGDNVVVNNGKSLALITEKGKVYKEINTPHALRDDKIIFDISGNMIVGHHYYNYIHITTDKGTTWTESKIPEKEAEVHSINVFESTIFVGANSSLYMSNDNGETWEKSSGIKKAEIHSMAKSGTTLYAGGKESENPVPLFYISTDNGKSWEKFNKDLEGGDVSHITADNNTVLISTVNYVISKNYGIYSLNKELNKWELKADKNLFINNQITGVAISDTNYVISGGDSYLISNNKGKTWNKVNLKIPTTEFQYGVQLYSSTAEPNSKKNVLYTLTYNGHLFVSVDNGANWEKCKFQADSEKAIADAAQAEKDKETATLAKQKAYNDSVATVKPMFEANNKILKNYFKGIAEMSYSNFDTALVRFNSVIAAKPDFIDAYKAREKCYRELKQSENAKKDSLTLTTLIVDTKLNSFFDNQFKKTELEVNKSSTELHTDCYYKDAEGFYLRAKAHYSSELQLDLMYKAIKLDTTKAEYYIFLGDLSRDNFYDVAAEVHYKKAARLNPKCEWYDHERLTVLTCGNCNGKGYRLQINITQQERNNTTHSTSDSERIACTQCENGNVFTKVKFPSVRLVK